MAQTIQDILGQIGGFVDNTMNTDYQNKLATAYARNPDYMRAKMGLQSMRESEQTMRLREQALQREEQQRNALRNLAAQMGTAPTGINPAGQGRLNEMAAPSTLQQYAQITGDLSPLIKMEQERALAQSGLNSPAALKQVEWYLQATPEERAAYDRVNKVGLEKVDLGDRTVFVDKTTGQVVGNGLEQQLTPSQELDYIKDAEAAKVEGKFMEEARLKLPKAQRTLASAELRDEFLNEKINNIRSKANPWNTGFSGSLMDAVPGSKAFDLKSDIQTLLANSGFDRLQEMRTNSPSGGALGSVSERELDLLQAAEQNLLQSQSYEQFQSNLRAFQEQRNRTMQAMRDAYEQDYKRYGGEKDQYLPTPEQTSQQPQTINALDFLNE